MKRLLLATNFAPASSFALKRALLLARLHNSILSVVHVGQSWIDDAKLARHVDTAVAELERDLEDDFGAGFRPTSIERLEGNVGESIADAAHDMKADLIVAGLSERLGGAIEGTLLEHLLMVTRTPLLVVKCNPRHNYERVLVGLDLGPTSRSVLEAALDIAFTADFTIVHANDAGRDEARTRRAIKKVVRQCFQAARKQVGYHEGAVSVRVEAGKVGDVMQRHCELFTPELVAFGKHDKGAGYRPHIGSGARAILERVDGDMLVTM